MSFDNFDVNQALSVPANTAATIGATEDPVSHRNLVVLQGDAIVSVEYIDQSFVISNDQPFTLPPIVSKDGTTWTIEIDCGRHKTQEVALGFNGLSGGPDHLYSYGTLVDTQPAELNFYFGLHVGLKVGNETIKLTLYLGQGSNAMADDWWMGSDALAHHDQHVLIPLNGPDGTVRQVFGVMSTTVNDFILYPWF